MPEPCCETAAGIPKKDDRGRTVDLHALRHGLGTHLSKNGVAPRTAQASMRHSSLDLTMNVYTVATLLDVEGALARLRELSLRNAAQADADLPSSLGEATQRAMIVCPATVS